MEIELSEKIGFCFGVRRAVKIAEDTLSRKNSHKVYSLGPIIHNPQVVKDLSRKGLSVAKDLKNINKGILVIRSHGMVPSLMEIAKKKKMELVDATCPFVKKAQKIAGQLKKKGYKIIIVGDKKHPEVRTLVEYSGKGAVVIENKKEAKSKRINSGRVAVIAQTTQHAGNFNDIVNELLKKNIFEFKVFNTICSDASKRQREAQALARKSDGVIVIGGKDSANTRRLAETCTKESDVVHIETSSELNPGWLSNKRKIAIVSGASTPDWIIKDVVKKIKTSL